MLTRPVKDNRERTAIHKMGCRALTIEDAEINAKRPRSATPRRIAADQGAVEMETGGTKGPTKGMACSAMVAADKPILARSKPAERAELTFAGYPDA